MLLLAGAEILCGHVHYTVCVYIEGHLYLRHASSGRSYAVKMETAQRFVVGGHLALALENVDLDGSLVVRSR